MYVTSELSATLIVSDSPSLLNHSHNRNSLPMKSRLLSSAIHPASSGVTSGMNNDSRLSSTFRVVWCNSASEYARRPAVTASRVKPKVWWNRLTRRSMCVSEVAPKRTSLVSRSHSTGMHLRRRKRPSLPSCSSRSRAFSFASRFCRALGSPEWLPAASAFNSTE